MSQNYPPDGPFADFGQQNQRGMALNMEPPILAHYPDAPVYDANTLVTLVKVRPLTLWSWEQQLGISSGETNPEADKRRRRSERDLVALLWIKEMVIAGESSQEAAARLLAAQRGQSGTGFLHSGALSTGALNPAAFGGPAPRGAPAPTGALSGAAYLGGAVSYPDLHAGPPTNQYPTLPPAMNANASGSRPIPDPAMMYGASGAQWNTPPPRYPTPAVRAGGPSGALAANNYAAQPQAGGFSGRLGGVFSAPMEASAYPQRGPSQSQSLGGLRELRPAIGQLLQSFARFDTARANAVLMEALRAQGVENVCVGLIQPAEQRIRDLWSKSELTNPEERFALNYLRTFLHSVYHSTSEPLGAPLAVVGCAPNETSDFGALLLAALWRRAGLRVVYLGRGI
ncbi:MAG: B12-binding domain-containing protein, partial [Chloroflexota bacterium]|nr:B12-binding domain-containing protein [Chloroflexota bacterium]